MVAPSPIHYCRHCPDKMEDDGDHSSHMQWVAHYKSMHGGLGNTISILYAQTGCTRHCLGRPLDHEIEKGERIWGTHPDTPRIPTEEGVKRYNELFPPEN